MKDIQEFRTRYAPSPTGFLHIGNARTALFAYLLAKHYKGKFLIRIEDTDLERNVDKGVINQLTLLEWLGINYDEGPNKENPKYAPYFQSKRLHFYRKYLNKLISEGKVYPCYCSKEELEEKKKQQLSRGVKAPMYDRTCLHLAKEKAVEAQKKGKKPVYRFHVSNAEKEIWWKDLIRGKVSFRSKDIEDFIIFKSNGFPVYNFANVIDDYLMSITHVVRGVEHLSNTPKQILLYEALSLPIPQFGHLPVIVNKHNKKLSKRDENEVQFISQYRSLGILPEAILNYLAFLGWSPGEEREIYSKKELIELFDFKRISKSPSQYNVTKLLWYNKEYLKITPSRKLYRLKKKLFFNSGNTLNYLFNEQNFEHYVSDILGVNEWTLNDHKKIVEKNICNLEEAFRNEERSKNNRRLLNEYPFLNDVLAFIDTIKLIEGVSNSKGIKNIRFEQSIVFLEKAIKEFLMNLSHKYNLKPKVIFQNTRKYLTNSSKGPDLWRLILIYRLILLNIAYENNKKKV